MNTAMSLTANSSFGTDFRFLSRYELIEQIGIGGMGVVYRAFDHLTQTEIALKSISIDPMNLLFTSRSSDLHLRRSLAREFRILARLRHPNIISVIDFGFDGQPFFTMTLLNEAQPITKAAEDWNLDDKKKLLFQVLNALQYLHRCGILHRDLKPSNILVTPEKKSFVLDFGLAMEVEHEENTGGTLAYMAPEVLNGANHTIASDLYSLGMVAYVLLAGEFPYPTDSLMALAAAINMTEPPLDELDIPPDLKAWLARLLNKDPNKRPQKISTDLFSPLIDTENDTDQIAIRDSFLQAARFVGRNYELKTLYDALTQITNSKNGAIHLIGGESGVGKTRLIEEIRILALVDQVQVLRGQSIQERAAPFRTWQPVLQQLALQSKIEEFEASILSIIVPNLDQLLGYPIPAAPHFESEMQQRVFRAVENLLAQQRKPILIILEDLQWANDDLKLLLHLQTTIQSKAIMVIGTYRHDEAPNLPNTLPQAYTQVLHRFSTDEIQELSISMLGQAGANPELLQLLEEQTEGNAFFIVEAMRTLAASAGKLDAVGKMTLPKKIVAKGIQNIVENRLSTIPEESYPIVELAALAGRQLHLQLLQALVPELDLEKWLQECASIFDVVNEHWQFAHDKIRETVIKTIHNPKDLHRQIALTWESITPNPDTEAVTLVYHWAEAGNLEKEQHYRILAGHQVLRSGASEEALRHFRRSLELIPPSQILEQAQVLNIIAEILLSLGDTSKALEYQYLALKILKNKQSQQDESSKWTLWQAILRQVVHRGLIGYPRKQKGKKAQQILLQGEILSHLTMLYSYILNDPNKSTMTLLNAINTLEHVEPSTQLAQGYFQMSAGVQMLGRQSLARLYYKLGLKVLESVPPSETLDYALVELYKSYYELSTGYLTEAEKTLLICDQLLTNLESKVWLHALNLPNHALTYRLQGRYDDSIKIGERFIEVGKTLMKHPVALAGGYAIVAQAAIRLHQLELATDQLEKRRALDVLTRNTTYAPYDVLLAWRMGDLAKVEEILPQAVHETINRHGIVTIHGYAAVFNTFEVCVQLWESGLSTRKDLPQLTAQVSSNAKHYVQRHPLGESRFLLFEGVRAHLQNQPQQAEKRWRAAHKRASQMGSIYDRILTEYYIYRYLTPDSSKLAGVAQAFQAINAAWDVQRTEEHF